MPVSTAVQAVVSTQTGVLRANGALGVERGDRGDGDARHQDEQGPAEAE